MFYYYQQNNSGGYYEGYVHVLIEADDNEEANKIALIETDIYFDGTFEGIDCSCCGDRWCDFAQEFETLESFKKIFNDIDFEKNVLLIRKEK